jgi:hypothetical protein
MSHTDNLPNPKSSSSRKKAPIIAECFKTRLCKTFRKTGRCEYAAYCMFAHGTEDLRTTDWNAADGLVSESAVKKWQRAQVQADEPSSPERPLRATPASPVAALATERAMDLGLLRVVVGAATLPRFSTQP